MKPLFRRRAVAVAGACVVLAAALAWFVLGGDERTSASGLAAGQVYSTDDGDPIDVVYTLDESGRGCIHLGGSVHGGGVIYGGSPVNCFDPKELAEGGTYKLVVPPSAELPALVVGVMPAGATGALVSAVGWETARAETQGQWFLASLEPADPSPWDLADIRVEFDY